MAKLTITADIGELLDVLEYLDHAISVLPRLPEHLMRRLQALADRHVDIADLEYRDGVMIGHPSGELLAVQAMVRGHEARAT